MPWRSLVCVSIQVCHCNSQRLPHPTRPIRDSFGFLLLLSYPIFQSSIAWPMKVNYYLLKATYHFNLKGESKTDWTKPLQNDHKLENCSQYLVPSGSLSKKKKKNMAERDFARFSFGSGISQCTLILLMIEQI